MPHRHYTTLLWFGWRTILFFACVGLMLALAISFLQPLKYASTVRLMVLQDIGSSVDAYTASRSEERIAENLSTILYTTSFFNAVMNAGYGIDPANFHEEDYRKRQDWMKTVSATVSRGAGIMTISAYHEDVLQAEQIVKAVATVLTEQAQMYTSGGNVEVRLIDDPLNSRWPVKPNILANVFSGFVLGGLLGIGYLWLQAERLRRRHQLVHEEL